MAAYLIGEIEMAEYNIGDKIKVVGFGGIYTTYEKMANLMGSEIYEAGKRPSKMTFEIKAKRKHLQLSEMVYLLKSEEGEFLFTNDGKGTEFVMIKKSSKEKSKPTKFVKVGESIFDLKEEFEKGELYAANGREKYFVINNEDWLTNAKSKGNIYRQVEIDWRDEVKGKYSLTDFRSLDDEGCINLGDWTPEGFIKLCHFVAELTDKPE